MFLDKRLLKMMTHCCFAQRQLNYQTNKTANCQNTQNCVETDPDNADNRMEVNDGLKGGSLLAPGCSS